MLFFLSKLLNKLSHYYWVLNYYRFRKTYRLDPDFRFNGKMILMYGEGDIIAGAGSYIGDFSTLQAAKGHAITIGIGCAISHNVRVYTQSAESDHDFSLGDGPQKYGDVTFEDYCWVGANVFVNPGIVIGKNSVIGANSVVTKDVPPFEVWGGVPAKLIRKKKLT
jgi:maltose O-acetyltransferase